MKVITEHDMNELTHRVADVFDDILRTEVARIDLNTHLEILLTTFGYAEVEGACDEGEKMSEVRGPAGEEGPMS